MIVCASVYSGPRIGYYYRMIVLPVLILLLVQKQEVHGSGYFELQILSIVNHRGILANGQCCGGAGAAPPRAVGGGVCPRECATYFSVCLKEYQSNVTSTGACSFGTMQSPPLGGNSFTLADPAKAQANIVLPFTFRWTAPGALCMAPHIWCSLAPPPALTSNSCLSKEQRVNLAILMLLPAAVALCCCKTF
ncbi:hypothetical protein B566_EDAN005054 [Ephemera danica]|nr:hypothetical protein B566_EDAN005054 [Ephemera danica]